VPLRNYSLTHPLTLPARPTNISNYSLIAVNCVFTPYTALDASVMSDKGLIEVTHWCKCTIHCRLNYCNVILAGTADKTAAIISEYHGSFSVRNTQYLLLDVKSNESITETAAVVGCAASRTQCILPTLMGVNSHVPPRPVLCALSLSSKLGVFNFVHFVRQFVPNFLLLRDV